MSLLTNVEISFNNVTDVLHHKGDDFIFLKFIDKDGEYVGEISFYFGDSGVVPQFWKDCNEVSELNQRKAARIHTAGEDEELQLGAVYGGRITHKEDEPDDAA